MNKPDYQGSRDEIVRQSIEIDYTMSIQLEKCCGVQPKEMFKSCKEYFVKCPKCGKETRMFKHLYQAKHAWNKEMKKEGKN